MRFLIAILAIAVMIASTAMMETRQMEPNKLAADVAFFIDEAPYEIDVTPTEQYKTSRKELAGNLISSLGVTFVSQDTGMNGMNIRSGVAFFSSADQPNDIDATFAARGYAGAPSTWEALKKKIFDKFDGMSAGNPANDERMTKTSAEIRKRASGWSDRRRSPMDVPLIVVRLTSFSADNEDAANAAAAKLFAAVKNHVDIVVLMTKISTRTSDRSLDRCVGHVASKTDAEGVSMEAFPVRNEFPKFLLRLLQSCNQPYESSECYFVQTVKNAPKGENLRCNFNTTYEKAVGEDGRYCWNGSEEAPCNGGEAKCIELCNNAAWIEGKCVGSCDGEAIGKYHMMIQNGTAKSWYYDHCVYGGLDTECNVVCTTSSRKTTTTTTESTTEKAKEAGGKPFGLQGWQIGVIAVSAVAVLAIVIVLIVILVQRCVERRRRHAHPQWYGRNKKASRGGPGGGGARRGDGDHWRDNRRDTSRRGFDQRRGGRHHQAPSMAPTITESVAPSVTQQTSMAPTTVTRTEPPRDRDRRRRR